MLKVFITKLMENFKLKPALYTLVLLIPLLSLLGYSYVNHVKDLLLTESKNSLTSISTHTSKTIARALDNNITNLKHFSLIRQLHEDLPLEEKMNFITQDPHFQNFSRLAIADLEGNALSDNGVSFSIADRDYFKQAKLGNIAISEPLDSKMDTDKKTIIQAVPLKNSSGKVTAILLANESTDTLTNAIANMYYFGNLHFVITEDNGQIVSQSATVPLLKEANLLELFTNPENGDLLKQIKHSLASKTTLTSAYKFNGQNYLVSYIPIPNLIYDWHLFVILPNDIALALTSEIIQTTAVLVIVIIALLSVIFIYILKTKKEYITALKISDYRYKVISEQTESIIFDWDLSKNSIYYSPAWNNKFTCMPPQNPLTDEFKSLYPSDIPVLKTAIEKLVLGEQISPFDIRVNVAEQKFLCVNIHPTLILDTEKKPVRIIGVLSDVTTKRIQELELKQKTEYDSLSKLFNRLTFEDKARQALDSATFNRQPLAFLFIDIDDFRFFNNNYGHAFGDRVITFIGSCLNNFCNNIGFAGRNGGDEFIVCITDLASINNIEYLTNRLQSVLKEGLQARKSDPKISIGSSIGIVKFPESGQTYDDLIKKADEGMYKAKTAGKGRYYIL